MLFISVMGDVGVSVDVFLLGGRVAWFVLLSQTVNYGVLFVWRHSTIDPFSVLSFLSSLFFLSCLSFSSQRTHMFLRPVLFIFCG